MKSIMGEDQNIHEDSEIKVKSLIEEGLEIYEGNFASKYPKLGDLFNNPKDALVAAQTCILMDQQKQYMKKLHETTIVQKFGDIAPRVLDILRTAYPNYVAHELVSVQVMRSTHDMIYYIKPVYSKAKYNKSEGQDIYQSAFVASEESLDAVGTGNGSTKTFTFAVTYIPIRPGTVLILKDGLVVGQDNGDGKIVNASGSTAIDETSADNVINYTLGTGNKVTFVTAPATGVTITCQSNFDSEQAPDITGGVDIVFSTFPVIARAHKLRLKWSVDAAITANSAIGLDVEDALSLAAAQELKAQRDLSVLQDLIRAAGAVDSTLTFDADVPSDNYAEVEHAQGFRRVLAKAGNKIFSGATRGDASWFVVGTNVEEYMSYLPDYVAEPNPIPIGIHRVGTYKGKPVYKTLAMNASEFIAGFKGNIFGDAGYVLAEYIELYTTPTLEMDDFLGRKGLASFYDKKIITPQYYKRGKISGTGF